MTSQTTTLVRASAPTDISQDQLGPLAELTGTWVGKGFNLVALPDKHENKKFQLKLNATMEILEFARTGMIPNRGNMQDDIFFFGLHYLQQVYDAETSQLLHIEPGLWLNLPATMAPPAEPSVARLGTIPHGDALLAQGNFLIADGGPEIGVADSTPFTVNPTTGARINDPNVNTYLLPYSESETPLPPGIPIGSIANPNLVLTEAINGQTITQTVVLFANAAPVGGINDTPIIPPGNPDDESGILNIPFVVANANANSFSTIFWIETVQPANDGIPFLQLQYTQTIILDFPVPGPDGNMVNIKWPHISVATLIKR